MKYGWRPDIPDVRDFMFRGVIPAEPLPPVVDLRPKCPAVRNQGDIGSCTAHSVTAMSRYVLGIDGDDVFVPSPLFLYYVTRDLENTIAADCGATLRNTMKALNTFGVCDEGTWPYQTKKFAVRPTDDSYRVGKLHQAVQYERILQRVRDMEAVLASGFPFVFGFTVYESFESLNDKAMLQLPSAGERALGGHAVCAVGYDRAAQVFIIQNSWGLYWGDAGYFYMPYAYIQSAQLASDFWTLRLQEDGTDIL